MKIFIPTRGRVDRQLTWHALPAKLRANTWIVCPREEAAALHEYTSNVLIEPKAITGIAEKRAWMMKTCDTDKLVMLDDDLNFYARGPEGLLKKYGTDKVVCEAFAWLEKILDKYAHASISPRLGNNRVEGDFATTTRMMHLLAYHVPTALANVKFNRVMFREDFDYTLQLLRKGYDNIVRYDVCVSPSPHDAKGGCSIYRTVENSNLEAEKLAALHPGLVRVVEKSYKGIPRKEVIVQWKKALGRDQ